MSLIPVLPLFLKYNRLYFQDTLVKESVPRVSFRWSDGRMKLTAGLYRSKTSLSGVQVNEIILSKPILENLPQRALKSTLIHAWN